MLKQNLKLILYLSIGAVLQINVICAETVKGPKIVYGLDATLNATGHQVSIRYISKDSQSFGDGHICGGSLISENVVLTAAHCFVAHEKSDGAYAPDSDFVIVMGSLNRLERNNNTLIFDPVKIVKVNKKFSSTLEDDIAFIILNGKVSAKHPTVRPIILNEGVIPNNTMCQVTGWGVTEENKLADNLKTASMSFIDIENCREKTGYGPLIEEGMICAGDLKGEQGDCFADSGGPLVCKGIQAGIVSFGGSCKRPLTPTVYTDVAFYKTWILQQVAYYNGTLPVFARIDNGVSSLSCSIFLISLMLIISIFKYN